jgi:hypothetical protein
MDKLLQEIRGHFDQFEKNREANYFSVFADNNAMLEGWFKGELLYLFTRKKLDFKCEKQFDVPGGKRPRRVDFSIKINGEENMVETKVLMLAQDKKHPRSRLHFYFGKDYIPKDIDKLTGLNSKETKNAKKWILAFIYPNPNRDELNDELNRCKLKLPDEMFLSGDKYSVALLRVK